MNRQNTEQLLDILQFTNHARSPIQWADTDVVGLRELLEFEGASVWFYRRLQKGLVVVPDSVRAALRESVHRTSVLNMRIDAQTVAVTTLLDSARIPWSLLKGQARRAAVSLYPFADARGVSDVDLLVPENRADEAWQLLYNRGFRRVIEGPVDWTADHHRPTLIDAANVAVELHTTTSMTVPPAEAWRRATENSNAVEWSGLSTHVPNATELVWQAVSHGAADGHYGCVLKGFLSVACVLAESPSIDWVLIQERIEAKETVDNETDEQIDAERVREYLGVCASLAGYELPARVRPQHLIDLVPLLVWRSRVLASSYSRAVKERLLEECGRVESRQPITPFVPRAGLFRNLRRRTSSVVARTAYRAWHLTA